VRNRAFLRNTQGEYLRVANEDATEDHAEDAAFSGIFSKI
jgi:hypothetical protein